MVHTVDDPLLRPEGHDALFNIFSLRTIFSFMCRRKSGYYVRSSIRFANWSRVFSMEIQFGSEVIFFISVLVRNVFRTRSANIWRACSILSLYTTNSLFVVYREIFFPYIQQTASLLGSVDIPGILVKHVCFNSTLKPNPFFMRFRLRAKKLTKTWHFKKT
jgi:hypothetical protein